MHSGAAAMPVAMNAIISHRRAGDITCADHYTRPDGKQIYVEGPGSTVSHESGAVMSKSSQLHRRAAAEDPVHPSVPGGPPGAAVDGLPAHS